MGHSNSDRRAFKVGDPGGEGSVDGPGVLAAEQSL